MRLLCGAVRGSLGASRTSANASLVTLDSPQDTPRAVGRQEWTCRVASTSPLGRGTACMSSIDHDVGPPRRVYDPHNQ